MGEDDAGLGDRDPAAGSTPRMRLRRRVETSSASPEASGVAPPAIEVLPPWGTSGIAASAQIATAAAISRALAGVSSAAAAP